MNLIKSKIAASSHGEIFDLNKHIEFLDVQKILSVFELRENEMTLPMPNAYQTCIYNRLALKDIKWITLLTKSEATIAIERT